jgi:hypothetical protein
MLIRVLERSRLFRQSLQALSSSSASTALPSSSATQHPAFDNQEKEASLLLLLHPRSRPFCSLPQMAPAAVTATRGRTSLELAETRFKDAGAFVCRGLRGGE